METTNLAKSTPAPGADHKLDHLEEYKAMHDEITLYQREMHRTWLWAIIPAGAVYTWLPLHTLELSIPWPVWFIPTVFFIICAGRWWTFGSRIAVLGEYLLELEKDAFGNGKENELRGMAHYNLQNSDPRELVRRARCVWVVLIACSSALSFDLSPMKSDGWVWMALIVGLIGCSFALYHYLSLTKSNGTLNRGPAYGHEREFRQQLADSVPVKDWRYTIQDIRFSEDYHKALVIFAVPGKTAVPDVVLEEDGFRRYKGSVCDYDKMAAAKPADLATLQACTASVTVTLPDK